jgi:DNA-binding CsgD family transcriptional regulator
MSKDLPVQTTVELTDREREILKLLATGTSNKEIARQLVISSNTVKVHLRNIFAKIGAASRTEAAMYAVHNGLVRTQAVPGQVNKTASDIASAESPARSRRFLSIASVTAILAVLVVVTTMGIFLARQQFILGTRTAPPPTSTPEPRWHRLAPAPTRRNGMAVAAYESQIYAIGGETEQGVTGSLQRYDPATDSWVELSKKPVPVTDAQAAVIGGKIYVPGGRTSSGAVTNAFDIYDPRQNSWEKGTDLPIAMSSYAMITYEGRLYLFGGWDGKSYLDAVYIYRPETESWSTGQKMPTARAYASAMSAAGRVFVVGGKNENGNLSTNESNDLRLDGSDASDWQVEESLPIATSNIDLVNVVDLVYAVVSQDRVNGIYVYHGTTGDQAKSWDFIPMPYELGRGFSAVLLGTKLYILGEDLANEQLALNVSYDAIYTIVLPITK